MQHLYESFEEEPGLFQFATAITSNDLEEIQKFLEAAVDTRYLYDVFNVLHWSYEPSTYFLN